ncbi:MAG: hypothetical protein MK135_08945, partial [Polyangiaceae bacterium]|nr:hypothetical protein [Polyangiaceae bacterium]
MIGSEYPTRWMIDNFAFHQGFHCESLSMARLFSGRGRLLIAIIATNSFFIASCASKGQVHPPRDAGQQSSSEPDFALSSSSATQKKQLAAIGQGEEPGQPGGANQEQSNEVHSAGRVLPVVYAHPDREERGVPEADELPQGGVWVLKAQGAKEPTLTRKSTNDAVATTSEEHFSRQAPGISIRVAQKSERDDEPLPLLTNSDQGHLFEEGLLELKKKNYRGAERKLKKFL